MSDTIIRVENLGKRYSLKHQQEGRQYKALRDVIADGAKSFVRPLMGEGTNASNPGHEDFWALRDVNFEIKQGDRVGIIGRNGAGKSTLLKILSRIVEPTEGRISIKGRVASLLEVGTGFHPELTGRENIYLNGAILGMGKAEIKRKFDEIVDFAEVEKFLDTPVKRYSSGMYVRLAFAVAAHLEPEILIVDEVLAVGDAQFQKKCLGKMEDVGKEGRTVLFVSHNMGAITQLCNKGIYLNRGHITGRGEIDDVVVQYVSSASSDGGCVEFEQNHRGREIFCKRLFISNSPGERANAEIDVRFPSYINIIYSVERPISNVELSVKISASDGRAILTSSQSDSAPSKVRHRASGNYSASVKIPEMFLMPGSYLITISFHEPMVRVIEEHVDILGFTVLESGTKFAKYGNHQKIGMILKDLEWSEAEPLDLNSISQTKLEQNISA